jgi:hypothetical protein
MKLLRYLSGAKFDHIATEEDLGSRDHAKYRRLKHLLQLYRSFPSFRSLIVRSYPPSFAESALHSHIY